MTRNTLVRLLAILAITASACSGDDGATGAQGPQGPAGADGAQGPQGPGAPAAAQAKAESCETCHAGAGAKHQAIYDKYTDTSTLVATIDEVASTLNSDGTTYTSTVKFTLKKNGQPFDTALLGQKRYTATKYDPTTKKFDTATAFSYANPTPVAGVPGQYSVQAAAAKFAPETSDAFVYFYFSEKATIVPPAGHYNLYEDVASVAKGYGALAAGAGYVSTANVSSCEKCHGTPYAKHGYRVAKVDGLADMVACKACHTDEREGTDWVFQLLVDDPLAASALKVDEGGETIYSPEQQAKYAYKATVMQDTHQSHAMEFAYPQSMANCVTCHAGKLGEILTDANFTPATCKSCHPVTGIGGTDAKRAPALKTLLGSIHGSMDLYTISSGCNTCHKAAASGGFAPTFAQIHSGYDANIYADAAGAKHSATIKTVIDSATFDAATNKLTVDFSVTGAAAAAVIKPTVVMALYGYDTKDFVVSGHSSTGGKRNLEWAEGAANNSDRLIVVPGTAAATWTATADLSLWSGLIADGVVKRAEIGILPSLDQLAIAGLSQTFDLVANAVVADADAYGKAIVDVNKCNNCHEALGTTFHRPSYGSAGVVGCRLCHAVGSGGSHLEMQSRSIDSYVHSIHAMQPFDVGDIDFTDPVAALRYEHHVGSTYPNFTLLNCESCHNPGTYEVPDQAKSLPGVLSAADAVAGRSIGAVPSYVTGPASRACGSCHRAGMINADDAGSLASFNEHTASFGTLAKSEAGVLDEVIAKVMSLFQ